MSNQLKSVFVILSILILIALLLFIIRSICKSVHPSIISIVASCVLSLAIVVSIFALFPYTRITDVTVELEKVAEIPVMNEFSDPYWYCMYEISYPFLPGSIDSYSTQFPFVENKEPFPKVDFTKYTYLISRGYEVKKLSYNVWDCHGTPILDFGLSTKWGTVAYENELDEHKLYIYRFPKKAVDNIACTDY